MCICMACVLVTPQQRQVDVGRGILAREGWGQEDGSSSGAPVDSSAGLLSASRAWGESKARPDDLRGTGEAS